jgi:murein DD-endopeptidase MepM/ murein hydrolase activator NlpD
MHKLTRRFFLGKILGGTPLRIIFIPILAAIIIISLVIHPHEGYTSARSDIEDALAKVKKQESELKKKREDALKQTITLKATKVKEVKNMQELLANITEQSHKLDDLNKEIDNVTVTVQETGDQLTEAKLRVKSREGLLKTRLRLMYMNGSVSYMDVLFSATSFSDFLDRYLALQNIVDKDKEILEQNKVDRGLVDTKKKQVESQLATIKALADEAAAIKDKLSNQEQQKEVMIASLNKQVIATEAYNEEAEKGLVALAAQRAALNKKKKELANSFKYSGGKVGWPVPDRKTIGDVFGYRIDPIRHVRKLHKGIDIPAPKGTTIVAAESGVVLIASQVSGYGNTVVIDHGGGLWTWYGHIRMGGIMVSEGDKVTRGQKIAEVGSTGDSTGNHLHFEVRINQEAVNPLPYLQ